MTKADHIRACVLANLKASPMAISAKLRAKGVEAHTAEIEIVIQAMIKRREIKV